MNRRGFLGRTCAALGATLLAPATVQAGEKSIVPDSDTVVDLGVSGKRSSGGYAPVGLYQNGLFDGEIGRYEGVRCVGPEHPF